MLYNIIKYKYTYERKSEMKIKRCGEPKVIIENPYGKHNFFSWPTAARLQNGKIAVVASGFRLSHVCPFGKTVISYSEDEGETYTLPAPVIDTPLDDRDGGILAFGSSNVIVTSFNNTRRFQKRRVYADQDNITYRSAYLDLVTEEDEKIYCASQFRMSNDCGVTFGKICHSPVSSPHGPIELRDGTVLWIGRVFSSEDRKTPVKGKSCIEVHKINPDGSMAYVGKIENAEDEAGEMLSCEPHAIELEDGTILCHIRAQRTKEKENFTFVVTDFTIYQTESKDGGKTWSRPHRILSKMGGAPSHLMKHSSGALIASYGHREEPYGIRVMISYDGGKNWDIDHTLYENTVNSDLGYPSTVELRDGSLITVFYAYREEGGPAVIMQQKWSLEQ